jgi:phage baseplate assembly protein W
MAIIKRSQVYTQRAVTPVAFSDVNTAFNFHPQKKDVYVDINEESVKQSIKNILLTNRGERLFNPILGSSVKAVLFEDISPQSEHLLKTYIETAIENFEPRANLIDVVATPMPDDNAYAVTIVFSIINSTEPVTLEFLLDRIR